MDSITFAEKKEKSKKSLQYKESYFLISSLLVIQRKQPPVLRVVSLGDPSSFLILHIYSKQATVSVAVSFLRNKSPALLSQAGINPFLQLVHCCRVLSSAENLHARMKLKLAFASVEVISIYERLLLEAFPLQSFSSESAALHLCLS